MSGAFGGAYADSYDLLYSSKDYDGECDLLERLFKQHANGPVNSLLDLGCGTGNHAIRLVKRGYEVTGVDYSGEMLEHAKRKAASESLNGRLNLHRADIRTVSLDREFDAVLIMFAVLGYQLQNGDVLSALKSARKHLKTGGMLIFDFWYGPAVLRQRPSQRLKVIPTDGGSILRAATGELDVINNSCTVGFHLWRMEREKVVSESEESHSLRYFFAPELNMFLQNSGFDPIRMGAFPDFDREPDETTWNAMAVARAF